jgi:hypothetical protein
MSTLDRVIKDLPCATIALLNEEDEMVTRGKKSITANQSPIRNNSFLKQSHPQPVSKQKVLKDPKRASKGMFTHLSPENLFKPKIMNMYKQSIQSIANNSKNSQMFSKLARTARKSDCSMGNNSYQ